VTLACHYRVGVKGARFGLPEVKWSIYPFGGATVKLVQQIGYVHAMDLILTGRLVDAAFAKEINLVNRVCAADEVLSSAVETATAIAANSPSAVQAVKQQISDGIAEHALRREAMEQQLGDAVRASRYFAEGVAAFREKRPAIFKDR
jgi:enoyl-CoA hydratase